MDIIELKKKEFTDQNKKLAKAYQGMQALIIAVNKKEIPNDISTIINQEIAIINSFAGLDNDLRKMTNKIYNKTIQLFEQKLKIVARNYYRKKWLAIGMSAFGIPMGVAFSVVLHNFAFIGIGIPIGMVIGMALGNEMDKKAEKEGRQLDLECQ